MEIPIPAEFTLEELQALLDGQEGEKPPNGYLTLREWREHFGITAYRMNKLLHRAMKVGALLRTKLLRENIAGAMQPRPAYKFNVPERKGD